MNTGVVSTVPNRLNIEQVDYYTGTGSWGTCFLLLMNTLWLDIVNT